MNKKDLNLETYPIPWHELQRFFATGQVIAISENIDLIDVAYQVSKDNKTQVEQWLKDKKVAPVSDLQAFKWYEENTKVWAVVVKPWILVQEKTDEQK